MRSQVSQYKLFILCKYRRNEDRTKNLQNANKRLRYRKADGEKIRIHLIELLKSKYRIFQPKMENEIEKFEKFFKKSEVFIFESIFSQSCEVCNIIFYEASFAKLLKSKNYSENMKHEDMIIPEWFFQEPIEIKTTVINIPKPLQQLARNFIQLVDKKLKNEIAKKMINPYYCADRNLRIGFKINLDSHHNNHSSSKLTNKPNVLELGTEFRYKKKT